MTTTDSPPWHDAGYVGHYNDKFWFKRSMDRLGVRTVPYEIASTTAQVRRALAKLRLDGRSLLIDRPGHRRGVVIVMPPYQGKCGLALFAPSEKARLQMRRLAATAIGEE